MTGERAGADPDHLFVYGTLLPGDVRWHHLAPHVVDTGRPDVVAGSLWDTRWGYPAAVFAGTARIRGRTFQLRSRGREAALALLDEVEDVVRGSYVRVRVTTEAGLVAWAYELGGPVPAGFRRLPSGNWPRRR